MSKAGNVRSDTDWDSVTVLTKKGPAVKTLKTQAVSARVQDLYFNRAPIQDINAAKRSGTEIDTSKKFAAGSNKQHAGASNATKLDAETDANHIPTVPLDVGRAIQQARQTKEWTQKELAQKINELQSLVADYEQGKAIPNQQVLAKMERSLGVKLRGKDIGQPLGPPGGKK